MRRGLLPAGLCAALALLMAALVSSCLNPRPEEEPQVIVGPAPDVPVGSVDGSNGGGAGVDLGEVPNDETDGPASREPDAGVPSDAGVAEPADAGVDSGPADLN